MIRADGPISVERYMGLCNEHYYATRDPLGAKGDFTTAPEISQMFGELVGAWLADLWLRAGSPRNVHYVELGPGRGTLAADALRAMRAAGLEPPAQLVETSPVLRAAQATRIPQARWHDDVSTLPANVPLLIVANEFFDALPIEQSLQTDEGSRTLKVDYAEGRFVRSPADPQAIVETSPASRAIVRELARRLNAQGGAALIVDYGHVRSGVGETLQSVSGHGYADPWADPGERDLSAHVDFEALEAAARAEGVEAFGPVMQGEWLRAMGIDVRAASLAKAAPEHAARIAAARERLTAPRQMGSLFKVLALTAKGWPRPEGLS
ncbi:MAG: SAM-dependent methyltransferase [Pseudomonadota bacterium]|nr:SAM-dependent methyltransferase [Pseudomonadota bacterium]